MSTRLELLPVIQEIAGDSLLQDSPYPVAAPATVEVAAELLRAASQHQYHVMVLGTGSSFPKDFAMLRENVLALMTVRLKGITLLSTHTARVLAGTPVTALLRSAAHSGRKTLGGLIGDTRHPANDAALRLIWPQVQAVEVLTASGEVKSFAASRRGGGEDPGLAELLIGSHGRLGLITAVEMATPLPLAGTVPGDDKHTGFDAGISQPILAQRDVQTLLDPAGMFQWS